MKIVEDLGSGQELKSDFGLFLKFFRIFFAGFVVINLCVLLIVVLGDDVPLRTVLPRLFVFLGGSVLLACLLSLGLVVLLKIHVSRWTKRFHEKRFHGKNSN